MPDKNGDRLTTLASGERTQHLIQGTSCAGQIARRVDFIRSKCKYTIYVSQSTKTRDLHLTVRQLSAPRQRARCGGYAP